VKIPDKNILKTFSEKELDNLCHDIRQFLIENVSKTGGHLASNLGIVEITLALHMEYDTPRDKILYDVGHQSYVHKLLTGREDGFKSLRTFGGLSGFTRPEESEHDAFVAGHASASLSAALGMARARTLTSENYEVAALIGDASISGGMALEALNDAGRSGEPFVIILNDNEMSISRNVGALAEYLSKLRTKPTYFNLKQKTRKFFSRFKNGERINDFISRRKAALKRLILPNSFFENMGILYFGPVDGHDIGDIRQAIRAAKASNKPAIIHCITTKGKGYKYSEENPENYHGTPSFHIDSGKYKKSDTKPGFSKVFGTQLVRMAREDQRICAITAGMTTGVGLKAFAGDFPKRFFDVGIAEEHAVTMSAGLAKQGMLPVCALYSTFLQRSYDQLIHDVAIGGLHVVFAIDRAGLVPGDGETHQGLYDIAYLASIPGMTVLCPSSASELVSAMRKAIYDIEGPVAVRYEKCSEGEYTLDLSETPSAVIRKGTDVTIACYGAMVNEVTKAAEILENCGISCEIVKLFRVNPLDAGEVIESVRKTGVFVCAEEAVSECSVGMRLAAQLALSGVSVGRSLLINAGMQFIPCGSIADLRRWLRMDAENIAERIKELL